LKKYERELLKEDWQKVRGRIGSELCKDPDAKAGESNETFILCRSSDRAGKRARDARAV